MAAAAATSASSGYPSRVLMASVTSYRDLSASRCGRRKAFAIKGVVVTTQTLFVNRLPRACRAACDRPRDTPERREHRAPRVFTQRPCAREKPGEGRELAAAAQHPYRRQLAPLMRPKVTAIAAGTKIRSERDRERCVERIERRSASHHLEPKKKIFGD